MADEPQTALDRRAAFGANFLGTTNLAQRRRYQEDIQAARNEEVDAQEQQFEMANRRAELADPLKARTIRTAEQRLVNQEGQFLQNLTLREKQAALQEQRFRLEEKKADYTLKKALREQATAEKILADTDAVEQADFELRQNGFQPGSKPYAAGMMSAFAAHPNINPDYRRTMWKVAEIEDDPDETMSDIQKGFVKPVVTGFVSPEGKKRYTVREGATETIKPDQERRGLIRDIGSMQKQLLLSASDPKRASFWNKQIKDAEDKLMNLDQPAAATADTSTPAAATSQQAPALVPRKAADGTVWLFDPATKQPVRKAE